MTVIEPVNILLVDDLNDNLIVLQSILGDLGEHLITASSGAEALQLVLKHEFAVILIDVNMPGIDGMEAAELIRRRKRSAHTPIIFMTAYADELHTARGYALGAVDCILSPVIPDVLRTKVKVFVDLFRMSRAIQKQADERVALAEEQARRTAAEETSRHYTFLAEAGRTLASTLDYDATCTALAKITLPVLGDVLAVTPADEFGGISHSMLFRLDDEVEPSDQLPAGEIRQIDQIENQEFACWKEFVPLIQQVLLHGEIQEFKLPWDGRKAMFGLVIPLRVQGKHLGALAIGRFEPRLTFSDMDRHLMRELVSRAAVALDNARLYSELQRADREKNEFLSMLAHELRNPLASICTAVHLLQMPSHSDQDIEWVRDVVTRQMTQLVRMVDDLLDVSRITQGKIRMQMSTVNPADFIWRAIETSQPLIEGRSHRLITELPTSFPLLLGDTIRLTQVVANLLNNAAKYTPNGGDIRLSVQCLKNELKISVKDNGIGIPADMQPRVFELFTQDTRALDRAQGGLGIGLTLVRRLTEMHGGSVTVSSAGEQCGSEFTVSLPIVEGLQPEPTWPTQIDSAPLPATSHTVLVVDDNIDAANGLSRLLRLHNYEVYVANAGSVALEMFLEKRPNGVLLDIGLPEMDGYEVARQLRLLPAGDESLLIAITGYGQEEDRKRSQEAGFDFHLVKPIDINYLLSLLDSMNRETSDLPANMLPDAKLYDQSLSPN